jgi:hypothetical protein
VLARQAYIFISSAVNYCAYMDETVTVTVFLISSRSIQYSGTARDTCTNCASSGKIYIFPVFVCTGMSSCPTSFSVRVGLYLTHAVPCNSNMCRYHTL